MLTLGAFTGGATGAPPSTAKLFRGGTERAVDPAATLERVRELMPRLGITRIANLTGLDAIGIAVVAVHRPNSRSLSVSQGKGTSLIAAQVSGLMESIENHHAERVAGPLLLGSYNELRTRHPIADVRGLPRLSTGRFHPDRPLLWMPGTDLFTNGQVLVPYEMVHTDFRLPLPTGSGAFVMSSNGLASGNQLVEAFGHAICELIERDANTLWHVSGRERDPERRIDLDSVTEPDCRSLLDRFEEAGMDVIAWDTTTDVGVPSCLCSVVEHDRRAAWPMPPVSGSGCHPRRRIALIRALTEAAQGRLTIISGSRDDLSSSRFDEREVRGRGDALRTLMSELPARRSFHDLPDADHADFETDVEWELERLSAAGLREAIAVNLTIPDYAIPVVRVIVPYLETMSELPGYVPGRRARSALAGVTP